MIRGILISALCMFGALSFADAAEAQASLYVGLPSSEVTGPDRRISVLIYDVGSEPRLLRRLQLWESEGESVRGLAGGHAGSRLYISTTRRLGAIDPASGRVIWERDYGGHCCDRVAVSTDGKTIYAPAFGKPVWYIVNSETGELISTVAAIGWPRSAAIPEASDRAYLAAWEWNRLTVVNTTTRAVVSELGPFGGDLCPFTVNRRGTTAFVTVDGLVGFEVVDLGTGVITDRVQIDGYQSADVAKYECPSNGIAFTPDEKELWLADGVGNRLRVFDAKVFPPAETVTIPLGRQPRWLAISRDGRYAFASTGDVIDVSSKAIVGSLKDERGAVVESERLIAP